MTDCVAMTSHHGLLQTCDNCGKANKTEPKTGSGKVLLVHVCQQGIRGGGEERQSNWGTGVTITPTCLGLRSSWDGHHGFCVAGELFRTVLTHASFYQATLITLA